MTTFERTWDFSTGNDAYCSTTGDHFRNKVGFLMATKDALVGTYAPLATEWTLEGSGGPKGVKGGGMDGIDRWGSVDTTSFSVGNWYCLRGPAETAFANIWVTVIISGTYGGGRFVVTDNAPVGGAQTTPPTFSGKTIDTGNVDVCGRYDGYARPYKITLGIAESGCWYALFTDGSGHIWPVQSYGLLELSNPRSGDMPCALYLKNSSAIVQTISATASTLYLYHQDGTTTMAHPMPPYYYNSSIFATFTLDDWDAAQPSPDFPAYVWASTAGKQAFRGRLIDIYFAPDGLAQNTVEPLSGPPYQSVKFGAFWWPAPSAVLI
jgi:hypothetical protein